MSTHHTIVLSTEHTLTTETWSQIFIETGGSMNLSWDAFEPSEVLEEGTNRRGLFFWTSSGKMDQWVQRLHDG